jgi:hypothetical protein
MNWASFSQYGFIGIVTGTVILMFYKTITWVMVFVKEQTVQQALERSNWVETQKLERVAYIKAQEGFLNSLNSINQSLQSHMQSSVEARSATAEAHKYQREEHIEMSKQLITTCNCLMQVEQSLGRINGYKKE